MSYGKGTNMQHVNPSAKQVNPATVAEGSADLNGESHFSDASSEASGDCMADSRMNADAASASDAQNADTPCAAYADINVSENVLFVYDSRNAHGMPCGFPYRKNAHDAGYALLTERDAVGEPVWLCSILFYVLQMLFSQGIVF